MNQIQHSNKLFFLVIVTYLAFISLGLPDGLLGIAWPYMSKKLHVPLDALGMLLISFTLGYLSTSSTSGKIIKLLPLGILLTISCLLTGLSLLTYAFAPYWYFMIAASFFLGAGGGAIDSSINTFAASRFSASTINWLHAFYGIGATTGPLLVTILLSRNLSWYHGYITVAAVQIGLAILFLFTYKNWQVASEEQTEEIHSDYFETLKLPIVWIHILIFFLYTGLEQGFGQWIFTILTKSRSLSEEQAGLWTSAYWGSLTVGRILFGIILTKIPVNRVLSGAVIGIAVGTALVACNLSDLLTLTGIIVLGISCAPVFPSLIAITPARIGKEHAATAIGVQISVAMIGASTLPGLAGLLSNNYGLEIIPKVFLLAAGVLLVLYFMTAGRRKE
jgi:fucose permease